MENEIKKLTLICDYEQLMRDAIVWYNEIYKTDFKFLELVKDEVNFAIIEYYNASVNDIFDLGRTYGRLSEAFDKKLSLPPDSSFK